MPARSIILVTIRDANIAGFTSYTRATFLLTTVLGKSREIAIGIAIVSPSAIALGEFGIEWIGPAVDGASSQDLSHNFSVSGSENGGVSAGW